MWASSASVGSARAPSRCARTSPSPHAPQSSRQCSAVLARPAQAQEAWGAGGAPHTATRRKSISCGWPCRAMFCPGASSARVRAEDAPLRHDQVNRTRFLSRHLPRLLSTDSPPPSHPAATRHPLPTPFPVHLAPVRQARRGARDRLQPHHQEGGGRTRRGRYPPSNPLLAQCVFVHGD
jgi:hypothetical protein